MRGISSSPAQNGGHLTSDIVMPLIRLSVVHEVWYSDFSPNLMHLLL
jgi:hypothetical protein